MGEKDNLEDLNTQFHLNYHIFKTYIAEKALNLVHNVFKESLDPEFLVPYPLDHEAVTPVSWSDLSTNSESLTYEHMTYGIPSQIKASLDTDSSV